MKQVQPFMPPGADGRAEPAPYLMTLEEAARFLRLESDDPGETLRRYRRMGLLKAVQIGRQVRYALPDLLDCIEKAKDANPR